MSAAHQIGALSIEDHAAAIARRNGRGKERRSGDTWTAFCPVHESAGEGNPSLNITAKDGRVLLHCLGHGCPQSDIVAELKRQGLWPDRTARRGLTLAEFADKKKLSIEFLQKCDVVEAESYHLPCVHFGYRLEDGSLAPRYRIRVALAGEKQFFWNKGTGDIAAYGLWQIAAAREKGTLMFVEGESDALTCWYHDIPAAGLPGAGTINKLLTPRMVTGISKLIVSMEPGEAGRKFRDDIIAKLSAYRWCGTVYVIDWAKTAHKDPSALHCADPDSFREQLKLLIKTAEVIDLTANTPAPIVDAGAYLPITTAAAWDSLRKANEALPIPRLFRHQGGVVRLERDEHGMAFLQRLDEPLLRSEAVRGAVWLKKLTTPASPSRHQIEDMFAVESGLPVLHRLTNVPVFAPDGTLVAIPGFRSGILYQPTAGLIVPTVSPVPTSDDVMRAYNSIAEMIGEFPFVGSADKAHAIALLLLPFVHELIEGPTPIHVVEAPQPGSGKGLLAESVLGVGLGHNYALLGPPPRDAAEVRKAITTALARGAQGVVWDNTEYLIAAELATAITARFWTDRLLGGNQWLRVDPLKVTWAATGNNLTYSRELLRRAIRIRIDAKVPDPENRDFAQPDLPGWVKEHRGELIWAALTLSQYWLAKGAPKPAVKPLGGFEDWSRVIGGILECAGIEGFLDIRPSDAKELSDDRGAAWMGFVARWWTAYGHQDSSPSVLFDIAKGIDGLWLGESDKDRAQRTSFGRQLHDHNGYTFSLDHEDDPATPAHVQVTFLSRKRGWCLTKVE